MKDKLVDRIEKIINNAPEIQVIRKGILQPIKIPEWEVVNPKALAQAIRDSLIIDENYLKDIIYITTQHLELPDKDVALLNRGLSDALLRANLIKEKEKR